MRDYLVYWRCPHGDAQVILKGSGLATLCPIFDLLDSVDEPLLPFLPDLWLDAAEYAVEVHEEQHPEATP